MTKLLQCFGKLCYFRIEIFKDLGEIAGNCGCVSTISGSFCVRILTGGIHPAMMKRDGQVSVFIRINSAQLAPQVDHGNDISGQI